MLRLAVRPLLRLTIFSLLIGFLPPAPFLLTSATVAYAAPQEIATVQSSTRIKDITFEGGSLTDATTGVDAIVTPVTLDSSAPLKGSYAARIPNSSTGYLKEDITATDELFVSFYLMLNATPASTA